MVASDDGRSLASDSTTGRVDSRLLALIGLATALGLAHHVDHVVRGNHVGWPLTGEVTAFTFSLGFNPLIALGLYLTLTGRVGNSYWLGLSGAGVALIAAVHFGPWAVEPPGHVVGPHESALAGYLALALVVALIAALLGATAYAWRRGRRGRARRWTD